MKKYIFIMFLLLFILFCMFENSVFKYTSCVALLMYTIACVRTPRGIVYVKDRQVRQILLDSRKDLNKIKNIDVRVKHD